VPAEQVEKFTVGSIKKIKELFREKSKGAIT